MTKTTDTDLPGAGLSVERPVQHDEIVDRCLPEAEVAIAGFDREWFGVSRLQRVMKIGYNNAAHVLERLTVLGLLRRDGWQFQRVECPACNGTGCLAPNADTFSDRAT